MAKSPEPILFLITGSRGSGKTTFCDLLARSAREAGWNVAGIISRPVFEGSQRTAIDAEDLSSGAVRRLAVRSQSPTPGSKHWAFDDAALDWGNHVFSNSTPCDLLIVDELGPLEIDRGEGWQAGLAAVNSKAYAVAVVVVRAELLGSILVRWSDANLVEIDTPEESTNKAKIISEQLF